MLSDVHNSKHQNSGMLGAKTQICEEASADKKPMLRILSLRESTVERQPQNKLAKAK